MYADMLKKAIAKSSKTLEQIADDCDKMGVKITKSYLSKLQNGKRNPPHESVTFALAHSLQIDPWELLKCAMQDNLNRSIKEGLLKNEIKEGGNKGNGDSFTPEYSEYSKETKRIEIGTA